MPRSLICALLMVSLIWGVPFVAATVVPVPMIPRDGINRTSLVQRAGTAEIAAARSIVKDAITKMTKLNQERLAHPARNKYRLNPGTSTAKKRADGDDTPPPPLLEITDEIAKAAALVAEVDHPVNSTIATHEKRAGTFWMEGISRQGTVPWGNDKGYKVFRNVVTDYKADPTGAKDSTAAIQNALNDGKRCGEKCNGSTTKNAIVYIPPGRYLVSSTLKIHFGTQVIGDANNWPRIIAAGSFVGLGVLSTDVYVDAGGNGPDGNALEWYINTARFYSQIRNLRIDITATDPGAYVCAVHYQVAQATSIEQVELIAKTGTTQQGMFSENGSGGVMSDVTFTGGNFGFYGGNQQFSASRMTFNGCKTAVQIIWDWGWVWKSLTVKDAEVGFRLMSDDGGGDLGSVSFIDSTFSGIKTAAIQVAAPVDKPGTGITGLVLDNVNLGGKITDKAGNQLLASGYYKSWVTGPIYTDGKRTFLTGKSSDYTRETTLLGSSVSGLQVAPYFERPRNQYKDKSVGDFVSLKSQGAKGDGATDDTKAVQDALNKYGDGSKILFVDAGTYILTDTVTIPKHAKIVGETWSQFAASGAKFSDPLSPRVMLKVGNDDDVGTVEMQDLILTTKGATSGAVLMEWNVKAQSAGAAALWDVHARVGGATGTGLTTECLPASTNLAKCQAASMLLHITKKASGYFDNMWLWVADHIIDDPKPDDALNNMDQISIYSARGFLIESQTATWLYGTASEHNVFYQYNFNDARNIFTTMIQTESPYFQPTPKPPAPFNMAVGKFVGDPQYDCKGGDFDGCDESWAVIMTGCQNVHIAGAGTYSWFSSYTQDCIDDHTCQKTLWYIDGNYDNNRLQHVIGIGAKNVMVANGKAVSAIDNLSISEHPAWSQISIFDIQSKGKAPEHDPDDECSPSDRLYSSDTMPAGSFTPMYLLEPENAAASSKYYITIVNLTPYKFIKTRQSTYQFDTFDFADIPSGKARQNTLVYTKRVGANSEHDNGEAYYALEGTDKQFTIRGTTHIPDDYPWRAVIDLRGMNLGQREYGFPAEETPVTVVITGSESYGYIASISFGPDNWQKQMYDVIKDRQLRHVVVPGSHDAGMSEISGAWNFLGTSGNSQTQGLNIYDQLRVGARWFDLRLVSVTRSGLDSRFWAAHVNNELSDFAVGATGDSLNNIIYEINKFTSDSPGEVIVLWVRYMVELTGTSKAGGGDPVRRWDSATAAAFYTELERINNRCGGMSNSTTFDQVKLGIFMDKNAGAGCVLIMTDGNLDSSVPADKPASGIYKGISYMARDDHWAEKTEVETNAADQISHMQGIKRGNVTADALAIMQWQVTPDATTTTLLHGLNVWAIVDNPVLYWDAVNAMSPETWPSVIMQDYVGYLHRNEGKFPDQLGAELKVLCIGLNLYMVSQNCLVSHGKWPLLKKPTVMRAMGAPFTGVIYWNGTVDENPPAGFHLDRVSVFKAGTDFGNGTILAVDTINPDFDSVDL